MLIHHDSSESLLLYAGLKNGEASASLLLDLTVY